MNPLLADTIAAAIAACVLPDLANWFPAEKHEELRETLYDLAYAAIFAYVDLCPVRVATPSRN